MPNVGIGTSSPGRLLHVAGAMRLSATSSPSSPAAGDIFVDSGSANALKYHNGTNWVSVGSGTGDLMADGSIPMTGNLRLNNHWLSGDGGNEGIYVNSSGNVGVGTTSPGALFHVLGGGVAGTPVLTAQTALAVQRDVADSSTTDAVIISGRSGSSRLFFGDTDSVARGGVVYDNSSDALSFRTAANDGRMSITSSGDVGIGTTSPASELTVSASAGGATHGITVTDRTDSDNPRVRLRTSTPNANGLIEVLDNTETTKAYIHSNGDSYLNGGNVGIGNTSPSYTLDVTGTMRVTGQAYTTTGDGAFTILSDARFKDVHGAYARGLGDVLNINPIRYNYLPNNPLNSDSTQEYVGVTAQNLQKAVPEAVKEKDGYLTVNTSPVLWSLVNAVKELYSKFLGYERHMAAHDRDIASVKAENAQLRENDKAKDQKIKELEQRLERLEKSLNSK